jgi:hypothetical protein
MSTSTSTNKPLQQDSDLEFNGLLDEAATLQAQTAVGPLKNLIKLALVVSLVMAAGVVGRYSFQQLKAAQKHSFNAESVVMLDGSNQKAGEGHDAAEEPAPTPAPTPQQTTTVDNGGVPRNGNGANHSRRRNTMWSCDDRKAP